MENWREEVREYWRKSDVTQSELERELLENHREQYEALLRGEEPYCMTIEVKEDYVVFCNSMSNARKLICLLIDGELSPPAWGNFGDPSRKYNNFPDERRFREGKAANEIGLGLRLRPVDLALF